MTGKLIVLDGNDGSGKATQARELVKRLRAEGHMVETIDFPQYDSNFFGQLIADAQCGDYGDWVGMDPHLTSVFYAADRNESKEKITSWLESGAIVIVDRYTSASQIHQAGKAGKDKRIEIADWIEKLEFEVFKLPQPDLVIYLDVDIDVTRKNLEKEKVKEYKEGRQDMTEENIDYHMNALDAARQLADHYGWKTIACSPGGIFRAVEDIHEEIYEYITASI